jgi:hypothetical protein
VSLSEIEYYVVLIDLFQEYGIIFGRGFKMDLDLRNKSYMNLNIIFFFLGAHEQSCESNIYSLKQKLPKSDLDKFATSSNCSFCRNEMIYCVCLMS